MRRRLALIPACLMLGAVSAVAEAPALAPVQAPAQGLVQGQGEERIEVPSGQPVTLIDVIRDVAGPEGLTYRFRFLAPQIGPGGSVGFEAAVADMQFLCDAYALPRIAQDGPQPEQIVISLADMAVPFGEAAPEATQFFEAFGLSGDACLWEEY